MQMLLNEGRRGLPHVLVITVSLWCVFSSLPADDIDDAGETWTMIEFDVGASTDYTAIFKQNCAVCHGERLEGAAQGTPLIGELKHGDSAAEIANSISNGFIDKGMPAWSKT